MTTNSSDASLRSDECDAALSSAHEKIGAMRTALIAAQTVIDATVHPRTARLIEIALDYPRSLIGDFVTPVECRKFPEDDPDVVLPSEPLAGSQAGLNGPSGSPTSSSGRDPIDLIRDSLIPDKDGDPNEGLGHGYGTEGL